ncbi:quaternary amine uptake ABC transporter (QAT) family, permease protein [Synechococcus sp. JA-2-3B'a(2-13)]|uniref:ABC transporter permease n=1 Tax=Synechococcus sp. (strain JA-2-3B'a(2-13)) TaxID=321332 RepID=UPI0000694B9A|nr:ABC transporter permease [Synechococcus sp. JA-2-3B'a(2-13)]ABD01572.1 quaternary amine uptake ABC transporter (QAT) family, permease protein [Synechococcus sp. JA-2-3B'a(2-13)]
MSYLLNHPGLMWQLTQEHLAMVGMTLGMAVVLAVPLALLVHHVRWLALSVMGILSILYTVPSLALIILLVPWLGLNARSVVVAMVIYTQVILVRHFCVGLRSVEPAILEAAKGMGMNLWQRWWQVQVPLMLPIVLAGLRLAAIVAIAIATVGAKFGAGGLGTLLFDGIAQAGRYDKIWAGSLAVGSLALLVNTALLSLEWAARRG